VPSLVDELLGRREVAMKGQGKVKGILIEGNDGHEYLLGFGPESSPVFSRRQADGGRLSRWRMYGERPK